MICTVVIHTLTIRTVTIPTREQPLGVPAWFRCAAGGCRAQPGHGTRGERVTTEEIAAEEFDFAHPSGSFSDVFPLAAGA